MASLVLPAPELTPADPSLQSPAPALVPPIQPEPVVSPASDPAPAPVVSPAPVAEPVASPADAPEPAPVVLLVPEPAPAPPDPIVQPTLVPPPPPPPPDVALADPQLRQLLDATNALAQTDPSSLTAIVPNAPSNGVVRSLCAESAQPSLDLRCAAVDKMADATGAMMRLLTEAARQP